MTVIEVCDRTYGSASRYEEPLTLPELAVPYARSGILPRRGRACTPSELLGDATRTWLSSGRSSMSFRLRAGPCCYRGSRASDTRLAPGLLLHESAGQQGFPRSAFRFLPGTQTDELPHRLNMAVRADCGRSPARGRLGRQPWPRRWSPSVIPPASPGTAGARIRKGEHYPVQEGQDRPRLLRCP